VLDEEVCLLIGLRPPAAGDVSGVQVILDGRETRRLDRSACGILDDVTPPDAITDLFPAGTIPGTTTPCGPSGDLDEFSFLVFKVDGAGSLKATAKFESEHLERSCFFGIGPTGTSGASVAQGTSGAGGAITPTATLPGGKALADGVVVPAANRSNGGGSASVANQPSGGGGGSFVNGAKALPKTSVLFVRIIKPLRQGAFRSVLLRVKSPQRTVRIQVKLIGKRGKVLGTLLRKVKANRTVSVPNLRLPNAVVTVRVRVLA
jgi:hypothetical protein